MSPPTRRGSGTPPRHLDQNSHPHSGNQKSTPDVGQDRATRWVEEEILGVIEVLTSAHLSAKAGRVPAIHLRRAAVRIVALDAAVTGAVTP